MRKELICFVCVLTVFLTSAFSVSAAETPPASSASAAESSRDEASSADNSKTGVSVANGVISYDSENPTEEAVDEAVESDERSTVSATGLYPFEIQYDTHNGAPIVIKSFRVPAGYDPSTLVEDDFEDTGFLYSRKDIIMREPDVRTEQKLVAQTVTFSTETNDEASLMSHLNPVMDYSESGFSGQLELDYNSIQSVSAGEESYSYPIRKTVEIDNLDNNDYAYLDKELDGLVLQKAEWAPIGGSQQDGALPAGYNADAVYTGVGYGTKVTGYNNSAIYKGYVTRAFDGESIFSVIYQGTQIETGSSVPWGYVCVGFLILLFGVGATWVCLTKLFPMFFMQRGRSRGTGKSDDVPLEL